MVFFIAQTATIISAERSKREKIESEVGVIPFVKLENNTLTTVKRLEIMKNEMRKEITFFVCCCFCCFLLLSCCFLVQCFLVQQHWTRK